MTIECINLSKTLTECVYQSMEQPLQKIVKVRKQFLKQFQSLKTNFKIFFKSKKMFKDQKNVKVQKTFQTPKNNFKKFQSPK